MATLKAPGLQRAQLLCKGMGVRGAQCGGRRGRIGAGAPVAVLRPPGPQPPPDAKS